MAVLFTVLFTVVEVLILVPPRNPANGLVALLRNCSSDRLADDPTDATTAADTRTSNETRFTHVSVTSPIAPSVPTVFPRNASRREINPPRPGYIDAHLKRIILLLLAVEIDTY